jgi:hypothetical protein
MQHIQHTRGGTGSSSSSSGGGDGAAGGDAALLAAEGRAHTSRGPRQAHPRGRLTTRLLEGNAQQRAQVGSSGSAGSAGSAGTAPGVNSAGDGGGGGMLQFVAAFRRGSDSELLFPPQSRSSTKCEMVPQDEELLQQASSSGGSTGGSAGGSSSSAGVAAGNGRANRTASLQVSPGVAALRFDGTPPASSPRGDGGSGGSSASSSTASTAQGAASAHAP